MEKNLKSSKGLRLSLNAESAIFFHHLVQEGLASYECDTSLPEGEIHAIISKDKNSKLRVKNAITSSTQGCTL